MKQKPLDNSGLNASVVGLGAWVLGGGPLWGKETDDAESVKTIQAALDNVAELLDPAFMALDVGPGHATLISGMAPLAKLRGHDRADKRLNGIHRLRCIDKQDPIRSPTRFREKPVTHFAEIFTVAPFHAVSFLFASRLCRLQGQIKHKRQIRLQSARGQQADLPQLLWIEPAGVSLIDHVGQQKPVANHGLAGIERRADHFGHELRPARHEQKGLARHRHVAAMLQQQNMTIPEFESNLRKQLLLTKLQNLALEGTVVTPDEEREPAAPLSLLDARLARMQSSIASARLAGWAAAVATMLLVLLRFSVLRLLPLQLLLLLLL